VNYQIDGDNMIIRFSSYIEFQQLGKPPHAHWEPNSKTWIINNYKRYIDDVYAFLGIQQYTSKPSAQFYIKNRKIFLPRAMVSDEDQFVMTMATDSRNDNEDYFCLPDCVGIRRIIRKYAQLPDGFIERPIDLDNIHMPTFLFDYQVDGVNWMVTRYKQGYGGAILADDMGLGKTIQSLSFYHVIHELLPNTKLFIISPKSTLKNVWVHDMKKFFNIEANVYTSDDIRNGMLAYDKPAITNYEALSYIYREDESKIPVLDDSFILILDEATKLKNSQTDIFKSIAKLRGRSFVLAMSGTPVENHLVEFFTILRVIQPNFLPQYEFSKIFVDYEAMYIGNKTVYKVAGHKNVRLFYNITSDFVLRRDKSIVNMPDKVIKNIVVPLTDEQQSLIEQVVDEARRTMDDEIAKIATLVLIKRISDHPRLVEMGDSKLAVKLHPNDYTSNKMLILKRLLAETPKPVVIFTEYEDMAQIICEELQNTYSVAMITGVMTSKQRNTILHDFKAGVYQVLVATDALAYGVNLQFANSLINFDIPWNPAKRAQRIDRIHRIGITEPKFIYDLVSEGLETHAYRLITDKLEIFAQAVEGKDSIFDSSVLKQLSADYFDTFSD